jgi:hypothetical protein
MVVALVQQKPEDAMDVRMNFDERPLADHGKLIRYGGSAAYLWHLREILTPGFREVHFEP